MVYQELAEEYRNFFDDQMMSEAELIKLRRINAGAGQKFEGYVHSVRSENSRMRFCSVA